MVTGAGARVTRASQDLYLNAESALRNNDVLRPQIIYCNQQLRAAPSYTLLYLYPALPTRFDTKALPCRTMSGAQIEDQNGGRTMMKAAVASGGEHFCLRASETER